MQKRYLFWLLIGVGVLVAGFVAVSKREREPEYGGKRLSEWVDNTYNSMPGVPETGSKLLGMESSNAVRQIGTNSVPYLLQWISYERPSWRKKLCPILDKIHHKPPNWSVTHDKKALRALNSVTAFSVLGSQAVGAIPELSQMMNDPKREDSAANAMLALASLGSAARPELVTGLTNKFYPIFLYLIHTFGRSGTNPVPVLVALLQDPSAKVRAAATNALRQIHPKALERANQ